MADDPQSFFEADPERLRLLNSKLSTLRTWTKPALNRTVGPFEPDAFDPFDAKRRNLISACADRLAGYTDEQIVGILAPGGGSTDAGQEWRRFLSDEIAVLIQRIPDWFIGGFGHPDHIADFAYWAKMPKFDVGELTCLSVGISPGEFAWKQLLDFTTAKDRARFRLPLEFLVKRFEQLHRKFDIHRGRSSVSPREFIEWADHFEFEVHPGFFEPLKRFHPPRSSVDPAPSARKQDRREVDSIAQLFAAMAIEQFGYDPRQVRSPTTKEIGDLAASLGMRISEDTILKYLRLGATFISSDWIPHQR